jgi:serine/threonine-protein kinase HipA
MAIVRLTCSLTNGAEGWRLAPAFDLNPVPGTPEHELSLDGAIHRGDLDVLRETAPFYRLSGPEAEVIIDEVRAALGAWRDVVHLDSAAGSHASIYGRGSG